MSGSKDVVVGIVSVVLLLGSLAGPASASADRGDRGRDDVYLIGNFAAPGDPVDAPPDLAAAADLAVAHLQDIGDRVTWERVPVSGTSAIAAQDAFLASAGKRPDAIFGFASRSDFVRVGPKVAATDQPFVALSSPPEGVRSGPSGGDNIFLVRPLDEQTDAGILDFVCTDLRKQLDLGDVRIALSTAPAESGSTLGAVAAREVPARKRCQVVTAVEIPADATDLTPQVQAIADSGANVVVSDDAPGPVGAFVNQLRRDGVTIPFVGGATLGQAVEAGAIENLDNLWATDDCVPELERSKPAKRFVKAYRAEYGVSPSAAAARLYDAVHVVARVVGAVGHDQAKINKALRGADSDGVCRLVNDQSNVMAPSVTVYRFKGPTDTTKVLVERVPLVPVPSEEPAATTTTTVAAG